MPFIETAAAVVTIGGWLVNLFGGIDEANAQEEAAKKNAQLKEAQAIELQQRSVINEKILSEQAIEQQAAYASLGQSGGEVVGGLVKMIREFETNKSIRQRELLFKTNMLRMGAEQDLTLASDIATAGTYKAVGTVLTGANKTYETIKKYGV